MSDAMTKAIDRWALEKNITAMNCALMLSRAQSILRSVVWRIFMKGIVFISTEVRFEDPAHASANSRVA